VAAAGVEAEEAAAGEVAGEEAEVEVEEAEVVEAEVAAEAVPTRLRAGPEAGRSRCSRAPR
jgi:hypothetical protein